jgi:uncharacterized membrane protein YkvA (DUF1232 family)
MFWLWTLKEKLLTFLIALTDSRTPTVGKVLAVLGLVYLLSPVDVLLDTIPFAGFLDDLVIVPLGLWLARKFVPDEVIRDAGERAQVYKGKLNIALGVLVALITVWILIILGLLYLLVRAVF